MVQPFYDIRGRDRDPVRCTGAAKAVDALAGNIAVLTVNQRDAPVPLRDDIFRQGLHSLLVVRKDAAEAFAFGIDADQRDSAFGKLVHRLFVTLGPDHNQHPVAVAVAGMLGIADLPLSDVITDKENIVAEFTGLVLEAVENPGKEFMGQTLFCRCGEENAEHI